MDKHAPRRPVPDSSKSQKTPRQMVGSFGEQVAGEHLRKAGYRILERNHRTPLGEIDIIADHKSTLVFVEVRTRQGAGFGTPQESVTRRKQDKLRQLADYYLQSQKVSQSSYRIDVVVVQLKRDGQVERVELIQNAVEGSASGY